MILKTYTKAVSLDDAGLLGLVLKDAKPHTNAGKMSARVVISAESFDRSNDLVIVKGMDLSDHSRNPVVLLNHNRDLPVGYAEDKLGAYTVRLAENRLVAETFFSQSTEIGEQAFRLVENKVLRGASVGFMPGMIEKSDAGGRLFRSGKLIEYSHVVLPDHQDCLVLAVEKGFGGRQLCDPLKALLIPYIEARAPVVQSGFVAKEYPMDPKQQQDDFAPMTDDPMMGEGMEQQPEHEEVVNQSFETAVHALASAWSKGEITGDELAQKLKVFIDAKDKLGGEGDGDDDIPNFDEDGEGDGEGEKDKSPADDDDEYEEKAWYGEKDAATIRKAYKFMVGIQASPGLARAKKLVRDAAALQAELGAIDPVVKMVRRQQSSTDWAAVLKRVSGLESSVVTK